MGRPLIPMGIGTAKKVSDMHIPRKAIRVLIALTVCVMALTTALVVGNKVLSLPFRHTNDLLHQNDAPVTLDLLIPAGIYIDTEMTIKEVLQIRFRGPQKSMGVFFEKISKTIPMKYRILSAGILYLFWVIVFMAFFRIVTWMRYATAMAAAFVAGAIVYYFMPDVELGRVDDTIFILWAACFVAALKWRRKRSRGD